MALTLAQRKRLKQNQNADRPICVVCSNIRPIGNLWLPIPLHDSSTGTLETCAWPCTKLALIRAGSYLKIDWEGIIRMIPEKRFSILEIKKECEA